MLPLAARNRCSRTQIAPPDVAKQAAWRDAPPAPRHVAALMLVVSDEGMSVSTLAAQLGISLATASQVVTDLEGGGLVDLPKNASNDAVSALINLGYGRAEAFGAVANVIRDQGDDVPLGDLIRESLKELSA